MKLATPLPPFIQCVDVAVQECLAVLLNLDPSEKPPIRSNEKGAGGTCDSAPSYVDQLSCWYMHISVSTSFVFQGNESHKTKLVM